MKKPLIKLYIVIIAALIAAIALLPAIVGRTSTWAYASVTQADLALYNSRSGDVAPAKDGARVVIVMDDGWETQYTRGYKILSERGMKACVAVVPSLVDEAGYVTYGQLAEMYKDGWDLLNHTVDHINLTQLSRSEQIRQVAEARAWLDRHHLHRGADIVVYPQGAFDDVTLDVLRDNEFSAGRSLNSVWDARRNGTREDIEVCNLISDITFTEVKAAIDKAVSNDSALILMLHKIEPVTDDMQMQFDEAAFARVADYLGESGDKLSVVTMTQLMAE